MNLSEVSSRTDALFSKYQKYTDDVVEKDRTKSNDRFTDVYTELLDKAEELSQRAATIGEEKNRALKAAQNAELRRAKGQVLTEELPRLEKLVRRGKKLTEEVIHDRLAKVKYLRESVESVPDGVHNARKPFKPLATLDVKGKGKQAISIDAAQTDVRLATDPEFYTHTEATRQFEQDWDVAKKKQDRALDGIEKGLTTLRGIGEAMGENVSQQDAVIDAVDEKMTKVTDELKTSNVKLKGLVNQMRSSRNFCLDVVLICIILGLALYLFELFKK